MPLEKVDVSSLAAAGQPTLDRAIGEMPQFAAAQGMSEVGDVQGSTGFAGGQAYGDLRGLGPNRALVLMDGRTVYTPLFSGVVWNAQDYLLEDINRIEVISGPGSTLWGANAVNGVINITSKSTKDTQGFHLEGGGGTSLRDFAAVRYGGTLGSNVYFRVYGKYFARGDEVFANGGNAATH